MRDYIDGLDGSIYRERHQTHSSGHVAEPGWFTGWMMDGVCDGFGDFFRFLAFVVVLQRYLASNGAKSQLAGYQYQLVSDLESSMCHKEKGGRPQSERTGGAGCRDSGWSTDGL